MSEDTVLRTMRQIAWERAKGEMNAMMHTFWGSENSNYDELQNEVDRFVEKIESEGLHE